MWSVCCGICIINCISVQNYWCLQACGKGFEYPGEVRGGGGGWTCLKCVTFTRNVRTSEMFPHRMTITIWVSHNWFEDACRWSMSRCCAWITSYHIEDGNQYYLNVRIVRLTKSWVELHRYSACTICQFIYLFFKYFFYESLSRKYNWLLVLKLCCVVVCARACVRACVCSHVHLIITGQCWCHGSKRFCRPKRCYCKF